MWRSTFVEIRNEFQCFFKASRIHYFKNARTPLEFICFFNNSSHVTEHFLHTSNEITTFLTNVSEKLKKQWFCQYSVIFVTFFLISEVRGLEDAFEPLGGPIVSKSITFYIETYTSRILKPSRISGSACQIHFVAVDAIHAIDAWNGEQYSAVKMSLDVSYWSGFLLG